MFEAAAVLEPLAQERHQVLGNIHAAAAFTLGEGEDPGGVFVAAGAGGDLYAGGSFSFATNAGPTAVQVNRLAKWNFAGSVWSALGAGVNATVSALAVTGTDLYAGGFFTTAGGLRGARQFSAQGKKDLTSAAMYCCLAFRIWPRAGNWVAGIKPENRAFFSMKQARSSLPTFTRSTAPSKLAPLAPAGGVCLGGPTVCRFCGGTSAGKGLPVDENRQLRRAGTRRQKKPCPEPKKAYKRR